MIPLVFGISVVLFGVVQAAPGGPEGALLETGRFIDPMVIEAYRNLSTTMGHSTGLIREQCPVW